jgi:ribosomal protein L37E
MAKKQIKCPKCGHINSFPHLSCVKCGFPLRGMRPRRVARARQAIT